MCRWAWLPTAYERQDLEVVGRVVGLPTHDLQRTRFDFSIEQARLSDGEQDITIEALNTRRVRLACYDCPYKFGVNQRWSFTVRLKRPNGFASWGAFDYEKYLFRHQIVATGYVRTRDAMQSLTDGGLNLSRLRESVQERLNQETFGFGVGAAIFRALALGDRLIS